MIRNIKALLNDDEIHWYHFSTSKFTDEQTVGYLKYSTVVIIPRNK